MPLTPIKWPGFGRGLNLADDPQDVPMDAAVDLLNVSFDVRDSVRQRDGYGVFTASAATNRFDSFGTYNNGAGGVYLMAGAGNRLEARSSAGTASSSTSSPTASPHFFASFGVSGSVLALASNGTDPIWKFSAASLVFSTAGWTGTSPTGKFVAVTPWDNRIVNARFSTIGSDGINPSSVRFNNNTSVLDWPANNYVDVTPGDGEEIMGMKAWGNYLFVFKESKFFVFNNTSVDSTGNPIFDYRTVNTGIGLCSPKALCAGPDGVYFLNQRGVYVTNGGPPRCISDDVAPFFTGGANPLFLSSTLNGAALTAPAMCWHNEQVYVSVPTGSSTTNDRVLVYDTRYKWWSLYDWQAAALQPWSFTGGIPGLYFAYAGSGQSKDIALFSSAYTQDAGSAITSRWLSGFADLGDPLVKSIRDARVWGKGTPTIGIGKDLVAPSSGQSVAFGSSVVPKVVRGSKICVRGSLFALQLSAAASAWQVTAANVNVRAKRSPVVNRVDV